STIKRHDRIEITHLRLQAFYFSRPHIGRICNEYVERTRDTFKPVRVQPLHTLFHLKPGSIIGSGFQSRDADIGAETRGLRQLAKQSEQEAAGAGACVQNSDGLRCPALFLRYLQCREDYCFTVWPRIERCG